MPKGAVLRQAVTLGKVVFRQVRKQGQTDCRGSSFQLENGRWQIVSVFKGKKSSSLGNLTWNNIAVL